MARTTIAVPIRGREEMPFALSRLAEVRGVDMADVLRRAVEKTYGDEFAEALKEYEKLLKKRSRLLETA